MYKLVISDDEGKTFTVQLAREEITIGRKEGNTIRLTERNVSRRHARLQKVNGHYQISDLGSYNGIVINGARVAAQAQQPLKAGDQIAIGDYKLSILEEAGAANGVPDTFDSAAASAQSNPFAAAAVPAPTAAGRASSAPPAPTMTPLGAAPQAPAASAPVANANALPAEVRDMRLVFLEPAGVPPPRQLERLPIIFGRSEAADVALQFSSISREHARLSYQNGQLVIEDMGSQNGILINGQKCRSGAIRPGDTVTLGVVHFRLAGRGDETMMVSGGASYTDLIEASQKKSGNGKVIAGVVVGLLAVGGIAAFAMRGGGAKPTASTATATTTTPPGTPAPPTVNPPTASPNVAAMNPPVMAATSDAGSGATAAIAELGTDAGGSQQLAVNTPDNTNPDNTNPDNTNPDNTNAAANVQPAIAPTVAQVDPPNNPDTQVDPPATNNSGSSSSPRSASPSHTARTPRANTPTTPNTAVTPRTPRTPTPPASSTANSGANVAEQVQACHQESRCIIRVLSSKSGLDEGQIYTLFTAYRSTGQRPSAVRIGQRYLRSCSACRFRTSVQGFLDAE